MTRKSKSAPLTRHPWRYTRRLARLVLRLLVRRTR